VWTKEQVEAATDHDIEIEMEEVKDKCHASDVKDDQKFLAVTAFLRVELRKRQKFRASEMQRMVAAEDDTSEASAPVHRARENKYDPEVNKYENGK